MEVAEEKSNEETAAVSYPTVHFSRTSSIKGEGENKGGVFITKMQL